MSKKGVKQTKSFVAQVKKYNRLKAKHAEYYEVYSRLRGQRSEILDKIKDADAHNIEPLRESLRVITGNMVEARNRSINCLKNVSEACEGLEILEIVNGRDRSEYKQQ